MLDVLYAGQEEALAGGDDAVLLRRFPEYHIVGNVGKTVGEFGAVLGQLGVAGGLLVEEVIFQVIACRC